MRYWYFLLLCPLFTFAQSESVIIDALVPGCGNGVVEVGETCDGVNLGGQSCSTLGFSSGALACSSVCTFDTSSCVVTIPPVSSNAGAATKPRTISSDAVVIRGVTTPLGVVWLLRDGVRIASVQSDLDGQFLFSVPGFRVGAYTMSMYTETPSGLRSSAFSFPLSVNQRGVTKYELFRLSPTLDIAETVLPRGKTFDMYGEATPGSVVTIVLYKAGQALQQVKAIANQFGKYQVTFPTDSLEKGNYTVLAYAVQGLRVSQPSRVMAVSIGDFVVPRYRDFDTCPFIRGDVNRDCRVDMRDILAAKGWQVETATMGLTELERLSGDGQIDMRDFSIILYNWTG